MWMITFHPTIIVMFVPAGCTGLFQPCDVGLQRIFKHSLKISAHEDIVSEVLEQLKKGRAVADVKMDTTMGVLCNRTVHWLWTAFSKLNKPEIIKKVCLRRTLYVGICSNLLFRCLGLENVQGR